MNEPASEAVPTERQRSRAVSGPASPRSAGAVRLVLVRHGQTDANLRRELDSRPPGAPLNALGRAQAVALGERLANEPVTAVYASQATRAQQTAAPLAAVHGLPVEVIHGVQEVFVGDLEGRSDVEARERFEEIYGAWWRGDLDAHLPGGESANDLRARFLPAVEQITVGATGPIVLVSHGAAIRLAVAALLSGTTQTRYIQNTGLVILRGGRHSWELEHWDEASPIAGDVAAGGEAS